MLVLLAGPGHPHRSTRRAACAPGVPRSEPTSRGAGRARRFPTSSSACARHFRGRGQPGDQIFSKAELSAKPPARPVRFITGSAHRCRTGWPRTRSCAVCNMAVGYNNIDIDACNARAYGRHQHARRADRDHRRLRLRADDGHGVGAWPRANIPAPRRVDRGPDVFARPRRARRDAGHPGHGPHRPGGGAARRARRRHEGSITTAAASRNSKRRWARASSTRKTLLREWTTS